MRIYFLIASLVIGQCCYNIRAESFDDVVDTPDSLDLGLNDFSGGNETTEIQQSTETNRNTTKSLNQSGSDRKSEDQDELSNDELNDLFDVASTLTSLASDGNVTDFVNSTWSTTDLTSDENVTESSVPELDKYSDGLNSQEITSTTIETATSPILNDASESSAKAMSATSGTGNNISEYSAASTMMTSSVATDAASTTSPEIYSNHTTTDPNAAEEVANLTTVLAPVDESASTAEDFNITSLDSADNDTSNETETSDESVYNNSTTLPLDVSTENKTEANAEEENLEESVQNTTSSHRLIYATSNTNANATASASSAPGTLNADMLNITSATIDLSTDISTEPYEASTDDGETNETTDNFTQTSTAGGENFRNSASQSDESTSVDYSGITAEATESAEEFTPDAIYNGTTTAARVDNDTEAGMDDEFHSTSTAVSDEFTVITPSVEYSDVADDSLSTAQQNADELWMTTSDTTSTSVTSEPIQDKSVDVTQTTASSKVLPGVEKWLEKRGLILAVAIIGATVSGVLIMVSVYQIYDFCRSKHRYSRLP